jgi:signal peptidase II
MTLPPSDDDLPTNRPLPVAKPLSAPTDASAGIPAFGRPSYVFLAIVAIVTFVADVGSKIWAEKKLENAPPIELLKDHVAFALAKNKGGAWGLLGSASESVRRPFFLLVSAAAILFIVTLYRRLHKDQRALKWGLPLVLGGALGNVFDRVRYGHVIDFIDFHMAWQGRDHHWPTFNVADIAICVGVGLMAVDMFTSKRGHGASLHPPPSSMRPPALPNDLPRDLSAPRPGSGHPDV